MITSEIKKLIDDDKTVFVCSHSGGKDSQAMYLYLKDKIPYDRLIVVHADLGMVEWKGVREHIEKYVTEHPLIIVKPKKTFFQMVEDREYWPSSQSRQCTSDQKTWPIFDYVKKYMIEMKYETVVNCMGIRAEESSGRAKKLPFKLNEKQTSERKKRTVFDWYPIFTWSTRDVFQFILKNGEKPHYAYELGMSRLSCCFCILANRQDLKVSAKHNPELLEQYAKLEKKIGHTVFMDGKNPIAIKDYINKPYKRTPKKLTLLKDCYV